MSWKRSLKRTKWSLIRMARPLKPIELTFDSDLRLSIQPIDRLGRKIFMTGYSDLRLAALLDAYLKPGMVFFDIGAHVGQYTMMAAKRVGPRGRVYSFEASQDYYQLLQKNVDRNQLSWVTTIHAAVYNTEGFVDLKVCEPRSGAFNSLSQPLRPKDQVVAVEKVRAVTVSGFCKRNGVASIDLMKIDVNGPEREVLQGCASLLHGDGAPNLICEFDDRTFQSLGYSTTDLRTYMESLGYQMFSFDMHLKKIVPEPPRQWYEDGNLLAIKDPHRFQSLVSEKG